MKFDTIHLDIQLNTFIYLLCILFILYPKNKQNQTNIKYYLGFISLDEFAEACELLRKHLPEHDTKEQLMDMCKLMDINKDGLVDLNEFLETFRLCEQAKSHCSNGDGAGNIGIIGIIDTHYNGVANISLNIEPGTTAPLANNKKSTNGLSGIQKQSTDDDEDDILLDCIEESPKKIENGNVTR